MTFEYPICPKEDSEIPPGVAINSGNPDLDEFFDFATPMGKCSGVMFGLIFQLPKWGFERIRIEEAIEVTPAFQQYYQLTIKQKQEMEAIIKEGLRSIATALSDLELLKHDLRKYKEFMDYFAMITEGKNKGGEEGDKLKMEGEQSLKSIFIDQVDVHTGEMIALKMIAPRWPTIIADFMRMKDEDTDPKKIAKDYNVSEAEGVVLATKNKLYKEWRDELFKKAVEERFKGLVRAVEARKKSLDEYKDMLKPTLTRFKLINEGISGDLKFLQRAAYWKPDTHAISLDFTHMWAWKPFAPREKYKIVRESMDTISASRAGFTAEDIEIIEQGLKADKKLDEDKKWDGKLDALPQEPSIDSFVRTFFSKIADSYGVKLTAYDLYQAREKLVENFKNARKIAVGNVEPWVFSPYFIFIDIPLSRYVLKTPDGSEIEDLEVDRLHSWTKTQNVIICHCVEILAKEKQMDNYIQQMLGEMGVKGETIEELAKDYIIKFGEEEEKKEKGIKPLKNPFVEAKSAVGKVLKEFGLDISFLRSQGPYEFAFEQRLTKFYFNVPASYFNMIKDYLKSSFGGQ